MRNSFILFAIFISPLTLSNCSTNSGGKDTPKPTITPVMPKDSPTQLQQINLYLDQFEKKLEEYRSCIRNDRQDCSELATSLNELVLK
ncbi:MAG: hypothetical protein KF799_07335 [Bdellovibrionales bacterium]|nr:hypothetical protein [Bdellovibrionales bacterium]